MSHVETENKTYNETKLETIETVSKEESVDPRVQVELERLNTATDLINKLEIELDDARSSFRLLLSESSIRVNQLAKKLGTCVEKARPYYEARMHAKQLQTQTQKAALRYERASSAHSAAKEMVYLAEEGLKKEGRCFDPAWQEMLNHATLRVNEAESDRVLNQHQHQKTSFAYNEAEKVVQHLHQELKKSIVKSRPYFEMKAQFNQLLEEQRRKVHHLEEHILKMKVNYADALHNLEEISDEIHEKRRTENCSYSDIDKNQEDGSHHFSCDSINAYQNSEIKSISSENIYEDNLIAEEVYMSLPSKLTLRPDLIATTCKGYKSEIFLPSNKKRLLKEESKDKTQISSHNTEDTILHKEKMELPEVENSQGSYNSDSSILHQLEQSNTSDSGHVCEENKFKDIPERPSENEEMPDFKFLVSDFNLLRIQKEEFSDSESLASNDTADTLDDNQIECLMLEKSLSSDGPEIETKNSLNDYTSNDSLPL
ncbi:hypothetical protein JTE90_021638 [Oedothorax gibbosus]|uniref:SH3 domain-binding protein 5-like n=1 Tax=Oedothorax gibbosus TaxID=931172 RepID=A0AAV6VQI2_9ARAC|nr:hypothetical protein JTE90_021638 [Oedothorax gibbosus]